MLRRPPQETQPARGCSCAHDPGELAAPPHAALTLDCAQVRGVAVHCMGLSLPPVDSLSKVSYARERAPFTTRYCGASQNAVLSPEGVGQWDRSQPISSNFTVLIWETMRPGVQD